MSQWAFFNDWEGFTMVKRGGQTVALQSFCHIIFAHPAFDVRKAVEIWGIKAGLFKKGLDNSIFETAEGFHRRLKRKQDHDQQQDLEESLWYWKGLWVHGDF